MKNDFSVQFASLGSKSIIKHSLLSCPFIDAFLKGVLKNMLSDAKAFSEMVNQDISFLVLTETKLGTKLFMNMSVSLASQDIQRCLSKSSLCN